MSWLSKFFPNVRNMAAANNAVLAEYELGLVELVPENPFAREMASTIVRLLHEGIRDTDDYMVKFFNGTERVCQLNLIARALADSRPPTLRGEEWVSVDNPFIPCPMRRSKLWLGGC